MMNPNDPGRSYYSGGGLTGGAFGHVGGAAVPMGNLFAGGPIKIPGATLLSNPGLIHNAFSFLADRGVTFTPETMALFAPRKPKKIKMATTPQKPAPYTCPSGG